MANFDRILSISLLFMIISVPSIVSRSTQSSDLIDGNEFLSLFIEKENADKLEGYELDEIRVTSTINGKNYEEDTLDVTAEVFNQDELLAEESTNYGLNLKNNSQNHKHVDMHIVDVKSQNITEMSADRSDIPNGLEKKTNDGKINEEEIEMKQIVKFITSGSKIVFLEDILKSNESTTTSNYTNYSTTNKDIVPNHSLSDNIHVSISVSSTVDKGSVPEVNKPNVFNYFESVKTTLNKKTFEDNNDRNVMKKADFISRSHKSEFSIEESDPVAESLSDSVNGESTNVHSVVAPPSSISQSSQQMTSENSRMQRKQQDKLVPFQTVIYHDAGYNKDGTSQPRSVSYSSLTQNVDDLSMWKDLESFLEVKRNVSDVLKPATERSHSQPEKIYSEPAKFYSEPAKMYGEPAKFYSQPAKVYSEPAKVYGEPERQHGLPAQIYSEPAKVYSEPAKTYSEPAKVYGEPSKVYWPLPLTTTPRPPPHESITQQPHSIKPSRRIISNLDKLPYDLLNSPESHKRLLEPDLSAGRKSRPSTPSVLRTNENRGPYNGNLPGEELNSNRQHKDLVTARPSQHSTVTHNPQEIYTPTPEQNYEIEESVSVMTNGRAHGVQPLKVSPTANPTEDAKVGYVVEGRNFRKYRVEEKTSDGFIVGEYGVVSHNDDSIRGVRYTADSNINPSLIQEALKKFLAL